MSSNSAKQSSPDISGKGVHESPTHKMYKAPMNDRGENAAFIKQKCHGKLCCSFALKVGGSFSRTGTPQHSPASRWHSCLPHVQILLVLSHRPPKQPPAYSEIRGSPGETTGTPGPSRAQAGLSAGPSAPWPQPSRSLFHSEGGRNALHLTADSAQSLAFPRVPSPAPTFSGLFLQLLCLYFLLIFLCPISG